MVEGDWCALEVEEELDWEALEVLVEGELVWETLKVLVEEELDWELDIAAISLTILRIRQKHNTHCKSAT